MDGDREDGFGLVEIIVAMTLLGLLLLAVAPLFVSGLKVTAKMTTVATATQLVSQELDAVRSSPGTPPSERTCATTESVDGRDVRLATTVCRSAGTRPTLVKVTATVKAVDRTHFFTAGQTLATATTEVYTG